MAKLNFEEHQPTFDAMETAGSTEAAGGESISSIPKLPTRPEAVAEMINVHRRYTAMRHGTASTEQETAARKELFDTLDMLTPTERRIGWTEINSNLASNSK